MASNWRPCPPGRHWRKEHFQPTYRTASGKVVHGHSVSAGCCDNPSKKDQIYSEELKLIAEKYFEGLSGPPAPDDLGFRKNGNRYDDLIRGWTRFWNDVLEPKDPLDPNLVKALIATESGFNPNPKVGRAKARGLMKVTDIAREAFGGEGGELKDHLVHVDQKNMTDPNLNIAAGVRWLFYKKDRAQVRLGRTASWDEAVAEYKDYLNKMIKDPRYLPRPMADLRRWYKELSK